MRHPAATPCRAPGRHLADAREADRLGESLHREPPHLQPPDSSRPAGLTCGTSRPAAPDRATPPPLYRHPNQFLGQRWSPRGGHAPTTAFRLLHTWLEHPDGREVPSAPPDSLPRVVSPQQRDFVEAHLGVDVAPVAPGFARRFTVHPDITFALRWTDRPGPGGPYAPVSDFD